MPFREVGLGQGLGIYCRICSASRAPRWMCESILLCQVEEATPPLDKARGPWLPSLCSALALSAASVNNLIVKSSEERLDGAKDSLYALLRWITLL